MTILLEEEKETKIVKFNFLVKITLQLEMLLHKIHSKQPSGKLIGLVW
jgi:hypothetical protein